MFCMADAGGGAAVLRQAAADQGSQFAAMAFAGTLERDNVFIERAVARCSTFQPFVPVPYDLVAILL